jgi:hypothetical protein
MRALTADGLARDLSRWLGPKEIRAILDRRERMQAKFDRLPRAGRSAAHEMSYARDGRP